MTIASGDWFEQIKDYIHRALNQNLYVIEGVISSRQLSPPSVKVLLQPYNVETGWIRIGTPYAGNGFGFMAIPPDGLTVKVIFDFADKASATVVTEVFNDVDLPPTLSHIDDMILNHASGSKLYFHHNGDVDLHAAGHLNLSGSTTSQTL